MADSTRPNPAVMDAGAEDVQALERAVVGHGRVIDRLAPILRRSSTSTSLAPGRSDSGRHERHILPRREDARGRRYAAVDRDRDRRVVRAVPSRRLRRAPAARARRPPRRRSRPRRRPSPAHRRRRPAARSGPAAARSRTRHPAAAAPRRPRGRAARRARSPAARARPARPRASRDLRGGVHRPLAGRHPVRPPRQPHAGRRGDRGQRVDRATARSSTRPARCPGALTMNGTTATSGRVASVTRRRGSPARNDTPWSAVTRITASS